MRVLSSVLTFVAWSEKCQRVVMQRQIQKQLGVTTGRHQVIPTDVVRASDHDGG
jgi:hypothetical protein